MLPFTLTRSDSDICRIIAFLVFCILLLPVAHAAITCGSTCYTSADVAAETTAYRQNAGSAKCLFIYNSKIYEPPASSISGGSHKGQHLCGADVTGLMAQTHLNNPGSYLTPYVCAPVCSGSSCPDADSDGHKSSACGGDDCNDANAKVYSGATEVCNAIDDNCNGQNDEGLAQSTVSCGFGACRTSVVQSCVSGQPTPACVPKTGAMTETCGNSIDDNCNDKVDEGCACTPGATRICGQNVGICKQGVQTCDQEGRWSGCVGGREPFVGEICNNDLDDDCNGQINDGCPVGNNSIYSLYAQPPLPVAPTFDPKTTSCKPKCTENCGQANGCGGNCPATDKFTWLKCGNPACTPDCTEHCGQGDGCGGTCDAADVAFCGKCGNPKCCVDTEVCGDDVDNNCDEVIDENCGVVMRLLGASPPRAEITSPSVIDRIGDGVKYARKLSLIVRASGLIAFFFAGLTLLVGIYRFHLIKWFSRAEIIKYHALVGFFSLFFLAVHILGAVTDIPGWGETVTLSTALIPTFNGATEIQSSTLTAVAWGVIGMYLLLITILTGIFFMRMARKLGYKVWLFLHRLSFAFYVFIFYHAWRIGSDFTNWYVRIFFGHVIVLIFIYVLYRTYQNQKIMGRVRSLSAKIGLHPSSVTIEDILFDQSYVDKTVITNGTISRVPLSIGLAEQWWLIHSDSHSLFALMPDGAAPNHYDAIEGQVRKVGPHLYMEVTKLKT